MFYTIREASMTRNKARLQREAHLLETYGNELTTALADGMKCPEHLLEDQDGFPTLTLSTWERSWELKLTELWRTKYQIPKYLYNVSYESSKVVSLNWKKKIGGIRHEGLGTAYPCDTHLSTLAGYRTLPIATPGGLRKEMPRMICFARNWLVSSPHISRSHRACCDSKVDRSTDQPMPPLLSLLSRLYHAKSGSTSRK